jgi:hypothetical protein
MVCGGGGGPPASGLQIVLLGAGCSHFPRAPAAPLLCHYPLWWSVHTPHHAAVTVTATESAATHVARRRPSEVAPKCEVGQRKHVVRQGFTGGVLLAQMATYFALAGEAR